VEENKAGDIMVVSHGMILKVIFGYVLGHGLDKFWIDPVPQNTSVTTISYNDGKFKMENFSNIEHLENVEEISYI
jgi:probable phosphoglycerate mutase